MASPRRVLVAHPRTFVALAAGVVLYVALPASFPLATRAVLAWDLFGVVFLATAALLLRNSRPTRMAANARAQQEGEWVIFALTLAGTVFSLVALVAEFAGTKDATPSTRGLHAAIVAVTLVLSWTLTHTAFALRYAHEYYTATTGTKPDGGLDFPGGTSPDYSDFIYFAFVIGMTFQVSDVQITSRKLRRLATVQGCLSFVFNTVIVALTVNLASNLL